MYWSKSGSPTCKLPLSLEIWGGSHTDDWEEEWRSRLQAIQTWTELRPFFLSKGYILFEYDARCRNQKPSPPVNNDLRLELSYPYASRTYKTDIEAAFFCPSLTVWAARDIAGRDVIIKVVGDGTPSPELDVLRFLNSEKARSDPRNHTIPIIEFINLEKFTFIVMPRWGFNAFTPDFATVDEIMHMVKTFLEVFTFLHEQRIFHADFLEQNTAIDVLFPDYLTRAKGLRDTRATRYVLLDFGQSVMYPTHMALDEITETREYSFEARGIPIPSSPYNPFSVEIYGVGNVLETWARHINNLVPALGPFLDSMIADDPKDRITAKDALERFSDIYANLSVDQLHQKVDTHFWESFTQSVRYKKDDIQS